MAFSSKQKLRNHQAIHRCDRIEAVSIANIALEGVIEVTGNELADPSEYRKSEIKELSALRKQLLGEELDEDMRWFKEL